MSVQAAAEAMVGVYGAQVEVMVPEALAAIEKAREELAYIEEQLRAAVEGQPFRNVGEVRGLQAGIIFRTFGAIEGLAVARRMQVEAGA